LGLEANRPSIKAATENARAWGVTNAMFQAGMVEVILAQGLAELRNQTDSTCVLLDPPRSGCTERVLQTLRQQKPEIIVYIACDPVMLARDLARLEIGKSWQVCRLACFNMFPQTTHFESVAILRKI
jgi:23S rRNA (uracil1939-C5)-methyltransferase